MWQISNCYLPETLLPSASKQNRPYREPFGREQCRLIRNRVTEVIKSTRVYVDSKLSRRISSLRSRFEEKSVFFLNSIHAQINAARFVRRTFSVWVLHGIRDCSRGMKNCKENSSRVVTLPRIIIFQNGERSPRIVSF